METIPRLSFFLALICTAVFAIAQPSPHQQRTLQNKPTSGTPEHYEGMATGRDQQEIPVSMDLGEAGGTFSGEITSSYGTFAITGGTRDGDRITLQFDANGETGTVSAQLIGDKLVGTYTAADQGGSIDLNRTKPAAATAPVIATPILILGVYHMENPGLEEGSFQADDVLSAKRQQELEELAGNLARFRPTKIAVEAPYGDNRWPEEYRKFLAGQHKQGRNEIEQIAFRLARRLNLPTLYPIDFPMLMNGQPMSQAPISSASEAAQFQKSPDALSPEERLLRQSTVTQYLAHLNSPAEIRKGQEGYMANLLPIKGPDIYQEADLVANWYKGNLRIFANINRITDPGKDRILVIVGSGHLKLLRDFAADAPFYDLVDAESFLN
jgi:hypothetical protein